MLVSCPSCGKRISDRVPACPFCGSSARPQAAPPEVGPPDAPPNEIAEPALASAPEEPPIAAEVHLELDVTWGHALRVWWAFAWRFISLTIITGFVCGCAIGFVVGFIMGMLRLPRIQIQLLVQLVAFPVGVLLSVLAGIWVMRMVLRKQFSDFRIVLRPR